MVISPNGTSLGRFIEVGYLQICEEHHIPTATPPGRKEGRLGAESNVEC